MELGEIFFTDAALFRVHFDRECVANFDVESIILCNKEHHRRSRRFGIRVELAERHLAACGSLSEWRVNERREKFCSSNLN